MAGNGGVTRIQTDVLVVGSEGAGARAAIAADEGGARVIMASKGIFGKSGVTLMAPFSCQVAFGHADPRDNPWEHFKDTVRGGHWLGNQNLVWTYTSNAPQRMLELESYGAKFNKTPDGKFEQVLMPGHTYPRAIHYQFRTGSQFRKGLMSEVARRPHIVAKDDFFVLDILKDGERVAGALAYDMRNGELVVVETPAVVLATGGAMELFYPHSDASCDMTGDGQIMALKAGCELGDVEFMQFFPTALVWPPALNAVAWIGDLRYSCGAYLYNKLGQRFMKDYDPERMELSTRDMTSRAIVTEMLDGRGSPHGGAWLSVTHLGRNQVEAFVNERFPNFTFRGYNLLKAGVDPRVDALEVAPIAHFYMGGVHYNDRCETLVPGLFVAGEVGAGVHGANRVEGNALSEIQVFGAIAGQTAAAYATRRPGAAVDTDQAETKGEERRAMLTRSTGVHHWKLRDEAQDIVWRQVGVVRTGDGLEKAVERLTSLREQSDQIRVTDARLEGNREFMEALETQNMLMLAEAMARAALVRTESRGSHFRRDFPEEKNPEWLKNTVVTLEGDALMVNHRPVEFPYYDMNGNERPPVA